MTPNGRYILYFYATDLALTLPFSAIKYMTKRQEEQKKRGRSSRITPF
jgi:hypothetical protein